jgi:hypothetical protein
MKGKTIKRMETVLSNKIKDLIDGESTSELLSEPLAKIEAIASIQGPISELEKRLNVKFDQKELDSKMNELKTHIAKKKEEEITAVKAKE